jgi:putative flippase GtrA
MTVKMDFYEKWLRRFVAFVGVGLINTGLTYLIYLLLTLVFSYQVAYAITFFIGIALSFFLNAQYVFKTQKSLKKYVLFSFVYIIQYLLSRYTLDFVVEFIGISYLIAPLIVTIALLPVTYLLTKKILK